jgi:hypothetical protein
MNTIAHSLTSIEQTDQVIRMNSRTLFMEMVRNIHYPQEHGIYSSILSNPVLRLHVMYAILFDAVVPVSHILMPSTAVISIANAAVVHVWPVSLRCEAFVQNH